jgi:hypothetical protein
VVAFAGFIPSCFYWYSLYSAHYLTQDLFLGCPFLCLPLPCRVTTNLCCIIASWNLFLLVSLYPDFSFTRLISWSSTSFYHLLSCRSAITILVVFSPQGTSSSANLAYTYTATIRSLFPAPYYYFTLDIHSSYELSIFFFLFQFLVSNPPFLILRGSQIHSPLSHGLQSHYRLFASQMTYYNIGKL